MENPAAIEKVAFTNCKITFRKVVSFYTISKSNTMPVRESSEMKILEHEAE